MSVLNILVVFILSAMLTTPCYMWVVLDMIKGNSIGSKKGLNKAFLTVLGTSIIISFIIICSDFDFNLVDRLELSVGMIGGYAFSVLVSYLILRLKEWQGGFIQIISVKDAKIISKSTLPMLFSKVVYKGDCYTPLECYDPVETGFGIRLNARGKTLGVYVVQYLDGRQNENDETEKMAFLRPLSSSYKDNEIELNLIEFTEDILRNSINCIEYLLICPSIENIDKLERRGYTELEIDGVNFYIRHL